MTICARVWWPPGLGRVALLGALLACSDARDADAPGSAQAARDNLDSNRRALARSCSAPPKRDNRTICGRTRIGPITPETNRKNLDEFFDPTLLADGPVELGEGETGTGTIVNRGRPDSATVVWTDETRSRILQVLRLGPGWRTEQGLGVGSSLAELVTALGPQVAVLGYGWDYGGTVILSGTALDNSGIYFRTSPRNQAADANARVSGDRPFAAISPEVRALDPVVSSVDVIWR
jgi:hypothetical protein